MSALWIIAIAVCLLFIWLLMQPKQGIQASNASRSRNSVPPPPKPQEIGPKPVEPFQREARLPHPPVEQVPPIEVKLSAPPPSLDAEVRQFLDAGKKIAAVKRVRDVTHWGLKDSKDYVEALERHEPPAMALPQVTSEPTPALRQDVLRLLAAHQKVSAVKLVRDQTHWSLRDSKQYVDDLQDQGF